LSSGGAIWPATEQEKKEVAAMSANKLPPGWDEEKVREVLACYEAQSDDEALVEDAASVEPPETVLNIPRDLVPKVREFIGKHRH
jgi:hypothetical protein